MMPTKRSSLLNLEDAIKSMGDTGFEVETLHHFGMQTYAREMRVAADSVIVGKIHRYPCINILSQGEVIVEGEFESSTYKAPHTWVSCAGTKRAICVLEDSVWTTIHQNPTDTRDLDEIEKYLIAETYSALEEL